MKTTVLLLVAVLGVGQIALPVCAQQDSTKPKNEITKLEKGRKTNHTTRQITPDPKKSPGKHADNLSKNVNHEVNRESKDFNHGVNNLSKSVNHTFHKSKK